jgi:hypothetical protein
MPLLLLTMTTRWRSKWPRMLSLQQPPKEVVTATEIRYKKPQKPVETKQPLSSHSQQEQQPATPRFTPTPLCYWNFIARPVPRWTCVCVVRKMLKQVGRPWPSCPFFKRVVANVVISIWVPIGPLVITNSWANSTSCCELLPRRQQEQYCSGGGGCLFIWLSPFTATLARRQSQVSLDMHLDQI